MYSTFDSGQFHHALVASIEKLFIWNHPIIEASDIYVTVASSKLRHVSLTLSAAWLHAGYHGYDDDVAGLWALSRGTDD